LAAHPFVHTFNDAVFCNAIGFATVAVYTHGWCGSPVTQAPVLSLNSHVGRWVGVHRSHSHVIRFAAASAVQWFFAVTHTVRGGGAATAGAAVTDSKNMLIAAKTEALTVRIPFQSLQMVDTCYEPL